MITSNMIYLSSGSNEDRLMVDWNLSFQCDNIAICVSYFEPVETVLGYFGRRNEWNKNIPGLTAGFFRANQGVL